jgi:hypothetical protein
MPDSRVASVVNVVRDVGSHFTTLTTFTTQPFVPHLLSDGVPGRFR